MITAFITLALTSTRPCCAFVSPTSRAPVTLPFSQSCATVQIRHDDYYSASIISTLRSADSSDNEDDTTDADTNADSNNEEGDGSMTNSNKNTSFLSRIKSYFTSKSDDGLTTRQRLAKLGFAVILSYGFVSNMSAMIFLSLAWFTFSAQTGLSPLAPNQWKPFTLVYAGFYVLSNLVRPIRITIAIAIGKYFDSILQYFQDNTKLSRNASIAFLVFGANVVCTCLALALGVSLASLFSGVPVFPSKVVGVV
eukprot:CAMPEP_0198253364 /NCGR_PEP_ID=MMETSP1447-20131203/3813_1 /TAXON_ID=420782 /ORGANISM="Chaetoceros dichaeta, Strain CCMP1751" /LENGTH=251 /DNA_ID=CAMNT_0043939021 /DNA_START=46 /DNA_END=801 /DNA_ORIENTATION=+